MQIKYSFLNKIEWTIESGRHHHELQSVPKVSYLVCTLYKDCFWHFSWLLFLLQILFYLVIQRFYKLAETELQYPRSVLVLHRKTASSTANHTGHNYRNSVSHENVGVDDSGKLVQEVWRLLEQVTGSLLHALFKQPSSWTRHSIPRLRLTPTDTPYHLQSSSSSSSSLKVISPWTLQLYAAA